MKNYSKILDKNCIKNATIAELQKDIIANEKHYITDNGAIGIFTGERTARSPKDRFIVKDKNTVDNVNWGEFNQPIEKEKFDALMAEVCDYLAQGQVYSMDCITGMDSKDSYEVKVYTELASQAMFCQIMFRDVLDTPTKDYMPEYTVYSAPLLKVDPQKFGINSGAFIGLDMTRKLVVICGTGYTCEIKKSIFAVFNYCKPKQDVLTMHCSCNCEQGGSNSALFFGLSGTGKTTLSNIEGRNVVGDDQNGWNSRGVFNIENGCYAKIFGLSQEKEPQIFNAIKDGALIENVPLSRDGKPDYNDNSITENTRATYPVAHLTNVEKSGLCDTPKNIFFLTADSTGVFPPISKLNSQQAMYYFLNGFTSRMTGTETNATAPQWVFSSCFGAPFMPLKNEVYAELLKERINKCGAKVWLVNTGWTGGKVGVGTRIKLKDTKLLVSQAINNGFEKFGFEKEEYFGLEIPKGCDGLSANILRPVDCWGDKVEYAETVQKIQEAFDANCKKHNIKYSAR